VIQPLRKDEEDYSTMMGSWDDFCYTQITQEGKTKNRKRVMYIMWIFTSFLTEQLDGLLSWLDLKRRGEDRTVFLGLGECEEGWPRRKCGLG